MNGSWLETLEDVDLAKLVGPAFASIVLVALVQVVIRVPDEIVAVRTKELIVSAALSVFVFSVIVWPILYAASVLVATRGS